jgi:general secretion pathway protein L
MSDRLIIRLPQSELESSSTVDWRLYDAHDQTIDSGHSTINELEQSMLDYSEDVEVSVLVPAETVLLIQFTIPTRQLRQVKQALPFKVEEFIAEDIENVHIATPQPLKLVDGLVDVVVVQHQRLINWLDILLSHKLPPKNIVVDVLCLPFENNSWTLLIDNDRILIRSAELSGMVVAVDDIELILEGLLGQAQSQTTAIMPRLNIISSATQANSQELSTRLATYIRETFPPYEIKESQYHEEITDVLAASVNANVVNNINLLQGGYSVNKHNESGWQQWKVAASIASLGLLSYLLLTLAGGWYFSSQAKHYDQQAVALYKELFPTIRRIVNPKKQMENYLRQTVSTNNSEFLAVLAETAKQLGNPESGQELTVQQLRFDNQRGDLQFEVKSKSLDQLDQLKQRLADAGLSVDINSATEQDNAVMGRIVVRGM